MDPYRVLGIPPTSTKEEVKAAFRRAALIHHPDRHANSPDAVKKQAETTFRAVSEAYQAISDGNYRYKQSASPGRAGFNRGSANPYTNYGRYGYEGGGGNYYYTYGSNPRRGGGFSYTFVFDSRRFTRNFVGSGSMMITAVLAGLALAGVLILEPILGSVWEDRNRGKLFTHIEEDVLQRHRAQQEARREARKAALRVNTSSTAPNGAGFAATGVDFSDGGEAVVMLPPPPLSGVSRTSTHSKSRTGGDEPPALPP